MSIFTPSEAEVESFVQGMRNVYDYARSVSPDVMVFPLRGAYPFQLSYQQLADTAREEAPDMLLLPLGTCHDAGTGMEHGLTMPKKREIVESELGGYLHNNEHAAKILLVDEVMNGGTILDHAQLIRRLLMEKFGSREASLHVCAVEGKQNGRRSQRYRGASMRHQFHRVEVEKLFTMDRQQFLPKVEQHNGDFRMIDGIATETYAIILRRLRGEQESVRSFVCDTVTGGGRMS